MDEKEAEARPVMGTIFLVIIVDVVHSYKLLYCNIPFFHTMCLIHNKSFKSVYVYLAI